MSSEVAIIQGASAALTAVAVMIPGPVGIALLALAELVGPVYEAIASGGERGPTVAAVKAALVAASDARMRAELGEST